MNRREYLLTCLAEECAEVAQRVSKGLRFGLDEIQPGQAYSNAARICDELVDLYAVATILEREEIIPMVFCGADEVDAKLAKIERFMAISIEQGALTPGDPS